MSSPAQELFAAYLDRTLPVLDETTKTVHFEWSVVICSGGRAIPCGSLYPFAEAHPDLGEWQTRLETPGFDPANDDDWDPLQFVIREPGPDPEAAMRTAIGATIDASAALRAWIIGGRRFLYSLHDSPPTEHALS